MNYMHWRIRTVETAQISFTATVPTGKDMQREWGLTHHTKSVKLVMSGRNFNYGTGI